jgi:hypothetical protein
MMQPPSAEPPRGVTRRAIIIGLLLIPLNAYWLMVAELRWYQILTLNPLFVTPIFFLLLGLIANSFLRRLAPRYAFSPIELATIYVILAVSCTISTHDYGINLMSTVGWPAWFATPENKWEATLFPSLPKWLFVWNQQALKGYYEGGSSLYRWDTLCAWLTPLAIWLPFALVCAGIMFCLNVLIRRAWIEETKLSFPVVRLPLAMLGADVPRFFTNRLMWLGVLLPVISGNLAGLHQLYPAVPFFQTRAQYFRFGTFPWNWLNWTPYSFYPFAIGMGYFVPTAVLFSCWFFFVFSRLQYVFGAYFGLVQLPGYPYINEQSIGAWTTYAGLLLYLTRAHWKRLVNGVRRGEAFDDREELLPYRFALVGCLLGLAALIGFWHAVGMSLIPTLVTLSLYFLLALAITRVRAEAGSQHTVWDLEPRNVFNLVDSKLLTRGDLVGGALSHWFWRLNRSHMMPTQLESLKIAEVLGLRSRDWAATLILATLVSTVAGPWAYLHVIYREGATAKCIGFAQWTGHESFDWLQSMMTTGHAFELPRLIVTVGASLLILGLWGLQARYVWLPLHPLGYCVGPWMVWSWFPFLIAWAVKSLILRYGGQPAYRNLTPFFLGLILGDYLTGSAWAIIGPLLQVQGYQIFH